MTNNYTLNQKKTTSWYRVSQYLLTNCASRFYVYLTILSKVCFYACMENTTLVYQVCKGACGKSLTVDAFRSHERDDKSIGYSSSCIECSKVKKSANSKAKRANPLYRAAEIVKSATRSDKDSDFITDITASWVQLNILGWPCHWCSITEHQEKLKFTPDRIDNKKGHVVGNVITACERCNYFRTNMPAFLFSMFTDVLKKNTRLQLWEGWLPPNGSKKKGVIT